MLDVTSSPGRSLSSLTNQKGRSRLGWHHPVILFHQYSTTGIYLNVAAQKEITAQKDVFSCLAGILRFHINNGLFPL